MKALVLQKPGQVSVQEVPEPAVTDQQILLKVRMVGFCGSDLNSFRGLNPLVSFPRILGHEVCATIVQAGSDSRLAVGTDVAVSTQVVANARHVVEDVRMPANSTRRLACKEMVPSLSSSWCRERSCILANSRGRNCA